jgi:outer membrane protein assembly factor BamE
MQINIMQKLLIASLIFFLFSCSTAEKIANPVDYFKSKIYKLDVQQGNVIDNKMLMRLKPGMTKKQVRFVLGTPLIQDSFHQDRWDYVYKLMKNEKLVEERHVVVYFKDDQLFDIKGEKLNKEEILIGAEFEEQSKVITITEEDYKKDEKNKKSLLQRFKFWDDDEADKPIATEDKAVQKTEIKETIESDRELKEELQKPSKAEEKEMKLQDTTKNRVDESLPKNEQPVEKEFQINENESINEAIRQDIIDSLPDESDPAYFDLLLEKIGF